MGDELALLQAVSQSDAVRVRALLESGASPQEHGPGGITPLLVTAKLGQVEIMTMLLATGASPDEMDLSGVTGLMFAAAHSQVPAVRCLLAAGATVNAQDAN